MQLLEGSLNDEAAGGATSGTSKQQRSTSMQEASMPCVEPLIRVPCVFEMKLLPVPYQM